MPKAHEYQSLPGEDCIRVLILAPGKGDEPLSGDLEVVHLSQPNLCSPQEDNGRVESQSHCGMIRWTADIPYEAISYVWGSHARDYNILLSGEVHPITANLSDALHQCRLPDQSRALWADSVCINQKDGAERNHQVYMMGRIYASSQRTLISLGRDPKNRHHAQDSSALIADVSRMAQEVFQHPEFPWEWNSFPWPDFNDSLVNDSRWGSVDVLCRNPWFTRGWIVQEAALGREARVLWSGYNMELLDLIRADRWYVKRARYRTDKNQKRTTRIPRLLEQIFFHERYAESKVLSRRHRHIEDPDILSALESARYLGISDARDRIYAFMALPFVSNPIPDLRPNYEQSHLELYQDFAVKYLEETSDSDILSYVIPTGVNEISADDGLGSSWAPRWNASHEAWGKEYGYAKDKWNFGQTSVQPDNIVILHGDNNTPALLQVRAVIFDPIELVSRSLHQSMSVEDLAAVWSQFAKRADSATRADSSRTTCDSLLFLKALSAGFFSFKESGEDRAAALKSYASFMQATATGSQEAPPFSPEMNSCHRRLMELAHCSHAFTLERGYFGLGPRGIMQGDICAFIFGVSLPLILRRVPGEGACRYNIITPAYVVSAVLDTQGLPRGLNQRSCWRDWNTLCKREGWMNVGLAEESIVIQ